MKVASIAAVGFLCLAETCNVETMFQELDVLAQELNHLGAGQPRLPEPTIMEDDSSDEEEGPSQGQDGTMIASDPPRPLFVSLAL